MAANVLESLQQQIVPAAGAATLSHDNCLVFQLAPGELVRTVRRLKEEFGFDLFLSLIHI